MQTTNAILQLLQVRVTIVLNLAYFQHSNFFSTQSISYSLPSSFSNFVLDFWIYPDIRHITLPGTGNYFFLTNQHGFIYNTGTSSLKNTSTSANVGFGDTLILGSWNHVIVYNQSVNATSTIYSSCVGNLYASSVTGSMSLTNIYFCLNNDTYVSACASRPWLDSFYRDIRIFDSTDSNGFAIAQYNL